MPLGWLATFTAILPTWGVFILTTDTFDGAPGGKAPEKKIAQSREELLNLFETNLGKVREALRGATNEVLMQEWTFQAAGKTIFRKPRYLVFLTYILNHIVHHRAQLGIYLRLNGIEVPAVYGGSAEEQGGMFAGE